MGKESRFMETLRKKSILSWIWYLGFLCVLLWIITINTGCSPKEEPVLPEDSGEATATDNATEGEDVDTSNAMGEILIHEIAIDLTNDGEEDRLSVYLTDCDKEKIGNVEELVAGGDGSVQIVVRDSVTEEILYDRTFAGVHTGEGQLSLVTDGESWYLMESSCYEQMGYANYSAEVFHWKDKEKITVDEMGIQFVISSNAASFEILAGEQPVSGEDVIPDFQRFIEGWSRDGQLIVAVDVINEQNNQQSVWVGTEFKEYTPEKFYDTIWQRETPTYTVGFFDELMGCSGYYIYEYEFMYVTGFYYSEEGELLAETWGSGKDGDFIVDLNGDGISELVSNRMWYADGGMATGVYCKKDSQIWYGYADNLLDEEYDNIGVASEYSWYLPEENVVEIFYWIDEKGDYQSKKYKIDLDKIEFWELSSEI